MTMLLERITEIDGRTFEIEGTDEACNAYLAKKDPAYLNTCTVTVTRKDEKTTVVRVEARAIPQDIEKRMGTVHKTGLKGQPAESIIRQFFGDLNRWPMVPDGINFTQSQIVAICEHISQTGHCLWHAQAIVLRFERCGCAKCEVH